MSLIRPLEQDNDQRRLGINRCNGSGDIDISVSKIFNQVLYADPNQDHGDGQHGRVTTRQLFIAGSNPTKPLLQVVYQPLHLVAPPIEFWVKSAGCMDAELVMIYHLFNCIVLQKSKNK